MPPKRKRQKRAPSAYNLYVKSVLPGVRNEMPEGTNVGQCMRVCSERWKGLSESEKATYVEQAKQRKQELEEASAGVVLNKGEIVASLESVQAYAKDCAALLTGASKKKSRTPSAYNIFIKENLPSARDRLPDGTSIGECMRECAKAWKALSASNKVPYTEKARIAKEESEAASAPSDETDSSTVENKAGVIDLVQRMTEMLEEISSKLE